jgi:hypothetical protein
LNTSIFIPKKINVGFQERKDTYTQKLAYIIYFDEKNVLRKEKSWEGWRDKKIDNIIHENIPTEGFVLNKKVGDYVSDWNHRQAYVRVYDPRNFEFEITIENLLYILENATSTKGKGLEGQFIYGWDGKDLILIPIESPDYKEIQSYNEIVFENKSIKAKELIIGATYKTKDNKDLIYMGKYDCYGYSNSNYGKRFWFYDRSSSYCKFETMKNIPKNRFIHVIDSNCCNDYAELFDELECYDCYSPVDNTKDDYEYYDSEYLKEVITKKFTYPWASLNVYCDLNNSDKSRVEIRKDNEKYVATKKEIIIEEYNYGYSWQKEIRTREKEIKTKIYEGSSIDELFEKLNPQYKNIYLKNGKLKGGKRNNE